MTSLILASSSVYRKELLQRLNLPFTTVSPDVDETPLINETADALVLRLAEKKAFAVAKKQPNSMIIASDQCLSLNGELLGKPGDFARAKSQLSAMSGQTATFYTSLCLLNGSSENKQLDVVSVEVQFRTLTDDEIERYLRQEQPYDCAGSFKSEKLGITLLESMSSNDPTALVGLPLIRLSAMLRAEGYNLP